jgi:hypothetical protein
MERSLRGADRRAGDAQQHQQGKKRQVLAQVNRDLFSTRQSAQLNNMMHNNILDAGFVCIMHHKRKDSPSRALIILAHKKFINYGIPRDDFYPQYFFFTTWWILQFRRARGNDVHQVSRIMCIILPKSWAILTVSKVPLSTIRLGKQKLCSVWTKFIFSRVICCFIALLYWPWNGTHFSQSRQNNLSFIWLSLSNIINTLCDIESIGQGQINYSNYVGKLLFNISFNSLFFLLTHC